MRWRLLKLDLPYLLGELVIVVLGVAIALSADRWRQEYQDRSLEAEYIERLHNDLLRGQQLQERRDDQTKRATLAIETLLMALDSENMKTRIVSDDELKIRCGPFKWIIKRSEISSINRSRNLVSSPALSLDRLEIHYGSDKSILVSPKDRNGFYRALGFTPPSQH